MWDPVLGISGQRDIATVVGWPAPRVPGGSVLDVGTTAMRFITPRGAIVVPGTTRGAKLGPVDPPVITPGITPVGDSNAVSPPLCPTTLIVTMGEVFGEGTGRAILPIFGAYRVVSVPPPLWS